MGRFSHDGRVFQRFLKNALQDDAVEGGIPVYSSNVNAPLGYVSGYNIQDDFDLPSILWGIDGIFDWAFMETGTPFIHTDHCWRLRILSQSIDPLYAFVALKATRHEYGFNRAFRASLANMKEYVGFEVPIDDEGNFDLERQKKIASRYMKLTGIMDSLLGGGEIA